LRFDDPFLLALLAAVPAVLFLSLRRRQAAALYSSAALLAGYRPTWRVRYRWLPLALRAIALGLVVVSLARPQSGRAETEAGGRGIDIALAFDISSSMSTPFRGTDSRLAVAQEVLGQFIEGRKEDRIGLVVFRDASLVLSPLTLDHASLRNLVLGVSALNIPDGTAIGFGLADAVDLLRESRARSRAVILLTDGENNNRTLEPLAAARIAEALGIRVYTVGLIEPQPASGGRVNVDERALREMANVTGGAYFSASSPEALRAVYANIDALEKSRVGRPQFLAYNELGVYFLAAALGLLALEVALGATVWRRATQ
jgi:Ca-activated chloride channel family protein